MSSNEKICYIHIIEHPDLDEAKLALFGDF